MKTYSVKEIADLLKTNPETVRRWIRTGKLKAVQQSRKDGNVVTEQSLKDFLESSPKYKSIVAMTLGIASLSYGLLGVGGAVTATATFIAALLAKNSSKDMAEINNLEIPNSDIERVVTESINEFEKSITEKKEEVERIKQEIIKEEEKVRNLKEFLHEVHSNSTQTEDDQEGEIKMKSWDYSNLSHEAKEHGGVKAYQDYMHEQGRQEGYEQGRRNEIEKIIHILCMLIITKILTYISPFILNFCKNIWVNFKKVCKDIWYNLKEKFQSKKSSATENTAVDGTNT